MIFRCFPHTVRYFFILLIVSFDEQRFFIFMMFSLFICFSFGACTLAFAMISWLWHPMSWSVSSEFYNFRSSVYVFGQFELTFVYGIKEYIYLECGYLVSPVQFIETSIINLSIFNWSIINNLESYIFKAYSLMFWCTSTLWNSYHNQVE